MKKTSANSPISSSSASSSSSSDSDNGINVKKCVAVYTLIKELDCCSLRLGEGDLTKVLQQVDEGKEYLPRLLKDPLAALVPVLKSFYDVLF